MVSPAFAVEDYFLTYNAEFIQPFGRDLTHTADPFGFDFVNIIPATVLPSQQVMVDLQWVFIDQGYTGSIVYLNAFGDWNPGTELARLINGQSEGSVLTGRKNFTFQAPSTPGEYRIRVVIVWAFAPVKNFYGSPPNGQYDPGVGPYTEVSFTVSDTTPPTTTQKVILAWGQDVPVRIVRKEIPFLGMHIYVKESGTMPAASKNDEFKADVLERVRKVFSDSGIVNIDVLGINDAGIGPATFVYFTNHIDNELGGQAYTGTDRYNQSRAGGVVIFTYDEETAETTAELISHETGHTLGLIHVNPITPYPFDPTAPDPYDLEVMDYDLHTGDRERFINTVSNSFDILISHNPVYHLKRYIDGVGHDDLVAQGINPGLWDFSQNLIKISLDFGTNNMILHNVYILSGASDCMRTVAHFEKIDLSKLSQFEFATEYGNAIWLVASSTIDSELDTILATGDPFQEIHQYILPVEGQTRAYLQKYSTSDSGYVTVADVNVIGTTVLRPPPNDSPLADSGPDQTVYAWIDGIAEVNLDGSASFDDDNDILTYKWSWTIDANTYEANGVNPTIELPVGQHIISLIVNDGIVDSEPNEVNITVIGPVEGNLCVMPKVLNCKSFLTKIMATLRLPKGITKDQIDTNEPILLYPGQIEADKVWISREFDFKCWAWRATISASFDKDELMDAIPDSGQVELAVVGRLKTGQYFFGTDTVTVICPGHWPRHRPWCNHRWNRWCHRPCNLRH
jgi:hypothetical protein